MNLPVLHSKIHRATVTGADLAYEGSLAVDKALMEATGMIPFQQVAIYNVTNGERLETYLIEAPAHSGTIVSNGAAAHKIRTGDLVIIAAYAHMEAEEARQWQPQLVFVDAQNRIVAPDTPQEATDVAA